MNLFKDIYMFFSYLDGVDIIFLVAIITLLILIVTLVYFIKINRDDDDTSIRNEKIEEDKKNELTDYVDKITIEKETESMEDDEEGELLDLEGLTKKLQEKEQNKELAIATEYEKDQEEKAIISYDELLKKHNKYAINYEKEEIMDDLVVKKVNLNDLENQSVVEELKDVRVISYEKEEAFLSALKELNRLLN